MAKPTLNPQVDNYLNTITQWKEESVKLREIVLNTGLTEEFKWMHPCYTYDGKNVVLIHGFKEYCALLFHKGALLKDTHGILIQQTENVQAARQIRFTNIEEIIELEPILTVHILEAIEIEKAGLKVKLKESSDFEVPEELQVQFDERPDLKAAFQALTPGRQRAYLQYFSQAKQSKTRASRVAKYIPYILNGKGLND